MPGMELDSTTATNDSHWPCVTAVVNTWNRPVLLRRALASVLAQDFTDFEVLVVHDGPADDDTVEICQEYVELFLGRGVLMRFMALEECSGYQCVPKNVGVWYAFGDYIAYLDDDNEWTPDHLSVLVAAIEEGERWPDFVYGRREYICDKEGLKTQDGHDLYVGPSPFQPFDTQATQRLATSPSLNFIDTSDALIAKGALWHMDEVTGTMWNESLRRFGDWELFARGVFYAGWHAKGIDHIVQRYHWHGENMQLVRPVGETPRLRTEREINDAK